MLDLKLTTTGTVPYWRRCWNTLTGALRRKTNTIARRRTKIIPAEDMNGYTNGEREPLLPRSNGYNSHSYSFIHRSKISVQEISKSFYLKSKLVLLSNYVNILLVFVPLGVLSGFLGWSPTATFILNFLAIIPLASLLSFATEELALVVGETLGGLLNATFGNAVELIVRILGELDAVYEDNFN